MMLVMMMTMTMPMAMMMMTTMMMRRRRMRRRMTMRVKMTGATRTLGYAFTPPIFSCGRGVGVGEIRHGETWGC